MECGVRVGVQVFRRKLHKYIHFKFDYGRNFICYKNKQISMHTSQQNKQLCIIEEDQIFCKKKQAYLLFIGWDFGHVLTAFFTIFIFLLRRTFFINLFIHNDENHQHSTLFFILYTCEVGLPLPYTYRLRSLYCNRIEKR